MTKQGETDRRKFLVVSSVAAAAGASGLATSGCAPAAMMAGRYDGGPVSDYLIGDFRVPASNNELIVGRDMSGFYAYSRVCTHQRCLIPVPTGGRSQCPCHNSAYNANGDLTLPAPGSRNQANLVHYVVTIEAGTMGMHVFVDTAMVQADRALRVPAA